MIEPVRPGVIAKLPRREFLEVSTADTSLSQMRAVSFKRGFVSSLRCLVKWFGLILHFALGVLFDVVRGRDSPVRRAKHLRRAFERNGGSFVKLGIHLSMRVDLVPWDYSMELSRMSDRMEPFEVKDAITSVERCTRSPLSATFARFDPRPISSSSIACTYQAVLRTGAKVAVKVRRPGIGEQFMADVRALGWVLRIAEFLTVFRPGFTRGIRDEFRDFLLEELDFVEEARRQDAFRRTAAESRKDFFSAPRVHLDLSGEEVVVSEFASGMWLWELLAAVERNDPTLLARARDMSIDPRKLANRLLWVNYWSWSENLFFHADPHPNNIIVGPDSTLYFVNFAETGSLNRSQRRAIRQNLKWAYQRDPQNMARSMLILMEPLPQVDVIELAQRLEGYNWQLLYALEAAPESLTWQERTSALQWVGMVRLARKYSVTIDKQVLRFLRSTLLFESMSARLHPKIDFVRQYHKFEQYRAEQARRRMTDDASDSLDGKNNGQLIIRLDRMLYTLDSFLARTSHRLSLPSFNFNAMVGKWSLAVYMLVRFLGEVLAITVFSGLMTALGRYLAGEPQMTSAGIVRAVAASPVYQIAILVLAFVRSRAVLFRLDDKEVSPR